MLRSARATSRADQAQSTHAIEIAESNSFINVEMIWPFKWQPNRVFIYFVIHLKVKTRLDSQRAQWQQNSVSPKTILNLECKYPTK